MIPSFEPKYRSFGPSYPSPASHLPVSKLNEQDPNFQGLAIEYFNHYNSADNAKLERLLYFACAVGKHITIHCSLKVVPESLIRLGNAYNESRFPANLELHESLFPDVMPNFYRPTRKLFEPWNSDYKFLEEISNLWFSVGLDGFITAKNTKGLTFCAPLNPRNDIDSWARRAYGLADFIAKPTAKKIALGLPLSAVTYSDETRTRLARVQCSLKAGALAANKELSKSKLHLFARAILMPTPAFTLTDFNSSTGFLQHFEARDSNDGIILSLDTQLERIDDHVVSWMLS